MAGFSICKIVLKDDRELMEYSEYILRTKVEVVVKDELDMLLQRIREKLSIEVISGKIFVLEVPATFRYSRTGKSIRSTFNGGFHHSSK